MSILKKAVNEQAFLKAGIFGNAGSGKTTTASYLAMAISNQLGNKKPIAFFETEAGSDFLVKRFELEEVELLRVKSHSLADLIEAGREAEATCSVMIVDSITHVWNELLEAKLRAINKAREAKAKKENWRFIRIDKLEFQHYNDIKREWARWTTLFLNSKLHIFVCGRAGNIWEFETNDETGKKELQKAGTKMRAEGEFGYEPSLLIEMERVSKGADAGSGWIHRAHILKDRSDSINGMAFDFQKPNATYKKGDWKVTFKPFAPAINALNLSGEHNTFDATRKSDDLFPSAEGEGSVTSGATLATIALEEIEGSMVKLWPGQDAKSKAFKAMALELVFSTKSWTAVSKRSLNELQGAVRIFRNLEEAIPAILLVDPEAFTPEKFADMVLQAREATSPEVVKPQTAPQESKAQPVQ